MNFAHDEGHVCLTRIPLSELLISFLLSYVSGYTKVASNNEFWYTFNPLKPPAFHLAFKSKSETQTDSSVLSKDAVNFFKQRPARYINKHEYEALVG
jgi:hypothetical protein